jgi:ClpP class serine protease
MRSDGATYKLEVVDKTMSAEDALKEAKEYAEQAQKAELIQLDKYPVKWREARRSTGAESWLYFKDNREYTVSVEWSTAAEPTEAAEFFSKVQMQ